jgi:peroxiredoxin Q/BCP
MLKTGDKAPDFRLKTDEGATLSLADFRGRRVVLFFFPRANTPG